MKVLKNKYVKKITIAVPVLLAWLLLWQIAAMCIKTELLFPSPLSAFKVLSGLLFEISFWKICANSLLRVAFGFVLGVVAGVLLAFLTNFIPFLDYFFRPALQMVRATPIASFILLVILWLSSGMTPIFISFLIVLPIVWSAVSIALKNVDKNLIELTRVHNFSLKKTVLHFYFPSILPYFSESCMTSLGLAWKASIAAEVLCVTKNSMGIKLYHAKIYLETPELFAWTIMIIVMSVFSEKIIRFIYTRVQQFASLRRKNSLISILGEEQKS